MAEQQLVAAPAHSGSGPDVKHTNFLKMHEVKEFITFTIHICDRDG
jgi:hypothetical protein